jgi:uroporphyrinogen-III synthase
MSLKQILITKTADDSTDISEAVRKAGFEPLWEPMLEIEYIEEGWPDLRPDVPLIFTSSHSVQAFALYNEGRAHPVYTVGRNTADTARSQGFADIRVAAATAEDLAELLSRLPEKDLISAIYIRAEDVSRDLRQILIKNGVGIAEFTGYRANPVENLSLNLLKSLDNREIYAVMFFSNRGAQVFAELSEQYDRTSRLKPIKALCISDSVLKSVSVLPFQQALVARTPDRYGMMELLENISVT